jgi:ATP-dependent helicase/nuclease subunit A
LTRTCLDERGRWILSAQHREAASELALTGIADGRLQNVIIDRSFIDADGTRWVIDFKTSSHSGGDTEAFLANELARYRAQLLNNSELARALGPEPVRAALYLPLLGAFRELSLLEGVGDRE